MAHQIEGNNAFFVSEPAWHGIGHVLSDAPSIKDAWKLAYEGRSIHKLPIAAEIDGHKMPCEDYRAIVRDDGKVLGIVGAGYELIQPYDAMAFAEPYIEAGLVELEAGGSLADGRRMWALAKVKDSQTDIVKGDPIHAYILIYTSFDGSLSHGIKQTEVRVVCANTLAAARADGIAGYKFKHTASIHDRIKKAQDDIAVILRNHRDNVLQYRALANKQVTRPAMVSYIRNVIVGLEVPEDKEIPTRTQNKLQTIEELLETQRGLELVPAVRGTAWQAYNAVSEYITHEHGRTADTRLNNQWFGESAKLNQRAMELALAL